jgi:ribosomal-protein-alanine N-acetyltransferase
MVEIFAGDFRLRPFTNEDAEVFHKGINSPRIGRDTTIPLPWAVDSILWWIGFISAAAQKMPLSEIHFVIEVDGKLAGSIGVINIDGHKCEIGYWMQEEYEGKGIMTKVVGLVSDYAFDTLKLKRLFAPILTHNKASGRVLEKNGFQMEGTLRKFYLKDGEYIDALCYAKVTD